MNSSLDIVITSGATREPIDSVRYISNVSTGRLGVSLTEEFLRAGHRVTLLRGIGSLSPVPAGSGQEDEPLLSVREFGSASSLLELLLQRLGAVPRPDLLIHAAAVADFAPRRVPGKLSSDQQVLGVEMHPTPKIVDLVRQAFPALPIVLFKLESGIERSELHRRALATLHRARGQAVVANLLEEVTADEHRADLLRPDGTFTPLLGRDAIARGLIEEAGRLVERAGRVTGGSG